MIDAAGKRDAHFDEVKTVNAEIRAFGRELLRGRSVSVTQLKQVTADVTVGRFSAADGATLLFVANSDRGGAAEVAVPVEGGKVELFDLGEQAWKEADVESRDKARSVKLKLPAGGGALVRWR